MKYGGIMPRMATGGKIPEGTTYQRTKNAPAFQYSKGQWNLLGEDKQYSKEDIDYYRKFLSDDYVNTQFITDPQFFQLPFQNGERPLSFLSPKVNNENIAPEGYDFNSFSNELSGRIYRDDIFKSLQDADSTLSYTLGNNPSKTNNQSSTLTPIVNNNIQTITSQPPLNINTSATSTNPVNSNFNYGIKPDVRKIDPNYSKMKQQTTPTGVKYEPPIVDVAGWKNIENQLNIAHPDGIPFTDNAQGYYGNIKDTQQLTNLGYQEQYYDDMLETAKGRQELAKMWQSKGKTLKGAKLPTETNNLTSLNDKELYEKLNSLRPAYLDSYPKVRKGEKYFNPNPLQTITKTQQPAVQQSSIPGTIPSLQAEKLNRLKGFNPNITALQLPDAYVKDPITVNNLQPEFYQPNTITPYLNDIQRLQYTTNTNLGTSGADFKP